MDHPHFFQIRNCLKNVLDPAHLCSIMKPFSFSFFSICFSVYGRAINDDVKKIQFSLTSSNFPNIYEQLALLDSLNFDFSV